MNLSKDSRFLAEVISKPRVAGAAWFLLVAYSQMQKERDELKKELLSQKQSELKIWKILGLCMLQKGKTCFEENTEGVTERLSDKEMCVV